MFCVGADDGGKPSLVSSQRPRVQLVSASTDASRRGRTASSAQMPLHYGGFHVSTPRRAARQTVFASPSAPPSLGLGFGRNAGREHLAQRTNYRGEFRTAGIRDWREAESATAAAEARMQRAMSELHQAQADAERKRRALAGIGSRDPAQHRSPFHTSPFHTSTPTAPLFHHEPDMDGATRLQSDGSMRRPPRDDIWQRLHSSPHVSARRGRSATPRSSRNGTPRSMAGVSAGVPRAASVPLLPTAPRDRRVGHGYARGCEGSRPREMGRLADIAGAAGIDSRSPFRDMHRVSASSSAGTGSSPFLAPRSVGEAARRAAPIDDALATAELVSHMPVAERAMRIDSAERHPSDPRHPFDPVLADPVSAPRSPVPVCNPCLCVCVCVCVCVFAS